MVIEATMKIPIRDDEGTVIEPVQYVNLYTNCKTGLLEVKSPDTTKNIVSVTDLNTAIQNAVNDNPKNA